jgi:hypothetical protein
MPCLILIPSHRLNHSKGNTHLDLPFLDVVNRKLSMFRGCPASCGFAVAGPTYSAMHVGWRDEQEA